MTLRPGLFVSGAAGGVTQPQDARLALAQLLSGVGVLSGGVVSGSTSGPNMKYTIAAGGFVTARGVAATDGLYEFANDGPVTVDSGNFPNGGPAPISGSRWDLIWVRAKNAYGSDGFGDGDSLPEFGVTCSSSGSSPTKPYSSVPGGALVLAEANVGTNIANASLATITMVAAASGGRPPKAANSTRYPASPLVGDIVDDATLGGLLRWNGTAWDRVLATDTGWKNITVSGLWSNDSIAPQARQIGNLVKFRGGIVDSVFNTTTFQPVFTLPSGIAAPPNTSVFPIAGPVDRRLRVLSSGEVDLLSNGTSGTAFSLDVVSYFTD